ncbi:hypothetical protein OFM15_31945, partial [Escherichia coli]|nr:hypothetical protein [Escherichia coli]
RILTIEATGDRAVSCLLPGRGLLADPPAGGDWPALRERVWVYERTAGGFRHAAGPEAPWAPFFGTIGVAPAGAAVAAVDAGG